MLLDPLHFLDLPDDGAVDPLLGLRARKSGDLGILDPDARGGISKGSHLNGRLVKRHFHSLL